MLNRSGRFWFAVLVMMQLFRGGFSYAATGPPTGSFDGADCNYMSGWTCDPDNFAQALSVHLYDGSAYLTSVTANQTREAAVGAQCGGNVQHGFVLATPASLKNGLPHTISAYAINIGAGTSNPLLTGSPKTITCTGTGGGTGTISGRTINKTTSAGISAIVTNSGVSKRTILPSFNYTFTGVVAGSQVVSVAIPAGYSGAEYNACFNNTTCHGTAIWRSATSATVSLTSGGYTDIWWRFIPATTVPTPILKIGKSVGSTAPTTWSLSPNNEVFFTRGQGETVWLQVSGGVANSAVTINCNNGGTQGIASSFVCATGTTNSSGVAVIGPFPLVSGVPSDWPIRPNYENWAKVGTSAWSNDVKYEVKGSLIDSSTVYLSDIPWVSATNNGTSQPAKDKFYPGCPFCVISIKDVEYAKGLGVFAPSTIIYNLAGGNYMTFVSDIGVDDHAGGYRGSVVFQVWLDGIKVYDSGQMINWTTATKNINLSVAGKNELKLVVTHYGGGSILDDYADWAGAKLIKLPSGFDYTMSAEPAGDLVLTLGSIGTKTITTALTGGATTDVTFSIESNFPSVVVDATTHRASATFNSRTTTTCKPTCSVVVTISADGYVPTGTYPVRVRGNVFSKAVTFNVVIRAATPPTPLPDPCLSVVGNWKAEYSGGRVDCFPVGQSGDLLLKETFSQIAGKVSGGWEGQMTYTTRGRFLSGLVRLTLTHGHVTTQIYFDGVLVSTRTNNLYTFETYTVDFANITAGEHMLQIKSGTDSQAYISGRDIGIEVHGPAIWGSGGGGGGGNGTPTSWGGTGIGSQPPNYAVQTETWFNMTNGSVPYYPRITVDGIDMTRPFNGGGVSLDQAYMNNLTYGWHTLTIAATPGFDIYMHGCMNCYDHSPGDFIYGNTISFNYQGGFVDFQILYFLAGHGMMQTMIGQTIDGKEWVYQTDLSGEIRKYERNENTGELVLISKKHRSRARMPSNFRAPEESKRPVSSLRALARTILASTISDSRVLGMKWGGCQAFGHVYHPSVHQLDFISDPAYPPMEQVADAYEAWQAVGWYVNPGFEVPYDYPPGRFDHNSVIAVVSENFPFYYGREIRTMAGMRVIGIALLWDEVGGQYPNQVGDRTMESDLLFSEQALYDVYIRTGSLDPYFPNCVRHELGHHLGLAHNPYSDLMRAGGVVSTYDQYPSDLDTEVLRVIYPECY